VILWRRSAWLFFAIGLGSLRTKTSQASEGRHGRKFPFDENASFHPKTRVVHRNAGVQTRFLVVHTPEDLLHSSGNGA